MFVRVQYKDRTNPAILAVYIDRATGYSCCALSQCDSRLAVSMTSHLKTWRAAGFAFQNRLLCTFTVPAWHPKKIWQASSSFLLLAIPVTSNHPSHPQNDELSPITVFVPINEQTPAKDPFMLASEKSQDAPWICPNLGLWASRGSNLGWFQLSTCQCTQTQRVYGQVSKEDSITRYQKKRTSPAWTWEEN